MSLEDIRSECSEIASQLQPYVDGEVQRDDQERVAEHLQRCQGCRVAVSEQAWVRATLQSVERDRAPQALRAKILLGLDDVERETDAEALADVAQTPPVSAAARMWARLRDFGKGGLIMVPAGAMAMGLFFVTRDGPELTSTEVAGTPLIGGALLPGAEHPAPAPTKPKSVVTPPPTATQAEKGTDEASTDIDDNLLRLVRAIEPSVGFDVQLPSGVSRRSGDPSQIQLVGASVDRGMRANNPGVRLRYELRSQGRATGQHLLDRQLPAGSDDTPGQLVSVDGQQYRLHRNAAGSPVVYFRFRNILHAVTLEGTGESPTGHARVGVALPEAAPVEYRALLALADRLRASSATSPGTDEP